MSIPPARTARYLSIYAHPTSFLAMNSVLLPQTDPLVALRDTLISFQLISAEDPASNLFPVLSEKYQELLVNVDIPLQTITVLAFHVALNAEAPDTEFIQRLFFMLARVEPQIRPEERLALLILLYNILPSSNGLRGDCFVNLASLALSLSSIPANIDAVLNSVDESSPSWGFTPASLAAVYHSCYNIRRRIQTPFVARPLLTRALQLAVDEPASPISLLIARDIVLLALSLPSHQVCLDVHISYDLLAVNPIVQSEQFVAAQPLLAQALALFNDSSIAQIEAYLVSDAPAQLVAAFPTLSLETPAEFEPATAVLSVEALRANLVALAVSQHVKAGNTYPVQQLADALQVPTPEDAEALLVEATAQGQITASFDDLAQTVTVTRVIPRRFDPINGWFTVFNKLIVLSQAFNKD